MSFLNYARIPINKILYFYYKIILGQIGRHSFIDHPLRIDGGKSIFIGERVSIKYKSWIGAKPLTGCNNCKLQIKDGCVLGHFNQIYSTKSIIIHEKVLTADNVYISDNLHGYEDIETPILNQPVIQNGTVEIGVGTWLGKNVCVIGANIGKHCVIGANSVVTHDIPDYSVAVGAPARVIKQYDFEKKEWIRV